MVDSPLLERVPLRPSGHRDAAPDLAADPAVHSADAAPRQGARLRGDLEQGEERGAAEDDHPFAEREARACAAQSRAGGRGRLGDALRRAVDRRPSQGAPGRGLRPHSRHSALSAILRRFDRDGRRQGLRGAGVDALAAGASDGRALLRRSCLYRRARQLHPRRPRESRLRTRDRARLLSRNSASLFRPGRSLLLSLRQDDATSRRGSQARTRSASR